MYAVGRGDAPAEREAAGTAEAIVSTGGLFSDWSFAGVAATHPPAAPPGPPAEPDYSTQVAVELSGPGRPLGPAVERRAGAALGTDVSTVRIHDDGAAHDTARRAGADALSVGEHVAFAPGRYDPHSADGQRRLVHELVHVVQARAPGEVVARRDPQKGSAPAPPAPTTLSGLPEADRRRIQVLTTEPVVLPDLKKAFDETSWTYPPTGVTVDVDAGIARRLHHGLRNVAGVLSTGDTPSLRPNTTCTLELDLSRSGGRKSHYRFTFTKPAPTGERKKPAGRIIIEDRGAARAPVGGKAPATRKGKAAPRDPVTAKIDRYNLNTDAYTGNDLEILRSAIAAVPDSHLSIVRGLRFARSFSPPRPPLKSDAAGVYDRYTHTVTMFGNAFQRTQATFVKSGVATSFAAQKIVHEIGHAVDLAPLRSARIKSETADAAVNAAAGTFMSAAERKRFNDAVKAAEKAAEALKAARSLSGSKALRTVQKEKGKPEKIMISEVEGRAADSGYRKAAAKDGLAVSNVGKEGWEESFAEAYSLYLTDPGTLRALRPATYAYLDDPKNLPK